MSETLQPQGEHLVVLVRGGGSTGDHAAALKDAVEAGLVPGVDSIDVYAAVSTADGGSTTGELRELTGTPAVGDVRRSISNLSAHEDAAYDFEYRFPEGSTPEKVRAMGEQLLADLSYADAAPRISDTRSREIIDSTVALSEDIYERREKGLEGVAIGHLVLTALALESDIDKASQEAGDLLLTRGDVIPVSTVPHYLGLRDGREVVLGEGEIDKYLDEQSLQNPDDFDVWHYTDESGTPAEVPTTPRLLDALERSDLILSGGSSWITSDIASAITKDLPQAIQAAKQDPNKKVIMMAGMTKDGDTSAMGLDKLVEEHGRITGAKPEAVIDNNDIDGLRNPLIFEGEKITTEGSEIQVITRPVRSDRKVTYQSGDPLADAGKRSGVRHDMVEVGAAMTEVLHSRRKELVLAS